MSVDISHEIVRRVVEEEEKDLRNRSASFGLRFEYKTHPDVENWQMYEIRLQFTHVPAGNQTRIELKRQEETYLTVFIPRCPNNVSCPHLASIRFSLLNSLTSCARINKSGISDAHSSARFREMKLDFPGKTPLSLNVEPVFVVGSNIMESVIVEHAGKWFDTLLYV